MDHLDEGEVIMSNGLNQFDTVITVIMEFLLFQSKINRFKTQALSKITPDSQRQEFTFCINQKKSLK